MEWEIRDLGFTKEEIEEIRDHFLVTLYFEDWENIIFEDENEEEDENFFKLSTGRMVYFPEELIHKEKLAQID